MKRVSALLVFAAALLFVASNFGVEAVELSLVERYTEAGAAKDGETGNYNFDKAHSFIGFQVSHMGLIEVPGFIRDFTGKVKYDNDDVTRSSVEFTGKMTSIDTGVAPRDNHLRSADFFEVEKFPDVTFKSTKVEKKGDGLVVTGDFTMKGVTKQIAIPFKIAGWLPGGERSTTKMGIVGETVINRRDYGVNYGGDLPNGAAAIGNDVKITLQIEAAKERPAETKTAEVKEAPKKAADDHSDHDH